MSANSLSKSSRPLGARPPAATETGPVGTGFERDPDLRGGPVEAEEKARQQDGAAEPDERGPGVPGRLKDRELGGGIGLELENEVRRPFRADVRDLRIAGEDPSGIDDVPVLSSFDEGRGVVRLGRARSRPAVVADDEVGDEPEDGDGRPVPGLGGPARPEDDPLQERRVAFPANPEPDLGLLPIPSVARSGRTRSLSSSGDG